MTEEPQYGRGDATFLAAGGEQGVRALVNSFYDFMATDPQFERIKSLHPVDTTMARDKLTLFLFAWMGGPRRYTKKYGPISIPQVHRHLSVTTLERDLWLKCMQCALAEQNYPDSLVAYLLHQLSIPAERVRQVCESNAATAE